MLMEWAELCGSVRAGGRKAVGYGDREGGTVQITWVLVGHNRGLAFTLTETGGFGRWLQKRAA